MTALPRQLLLALGLVFAGAVVGWFSHARQLSKAQAGWKSAVEVAQIQTDAALEKARQEQQRADSLSEVAGHAAAQARALESRQGTLRARTALLEVDLSRALTRADSGGIALAMLPALREERDVAEQKAGQWHAAYEAEVEAASALRSRGDSLERVVVRQDSLLARGLEVVGSSGCRIPILGLKCPTVILGYGAVADLSSGAVTVRHGPTVAAGWTLF